MISTKKSNFDIAIINTNMTKKIALNKTKGQQNLNLASKDLRDYEK